MIFNGGADGDFLPDTPDNDVIHGGGGSDTIFSIMGSDYLYGDAGDDQLSVIRLLGETGRVRLYGGDGDDAINYEGMANTVEVYVSGGQGGDRVTLANPYSFDVLTHDGDDSVSITGGNAGSISTGTGRDRVSVSDSMDGTTTIDLGDGDDFLTVISRNRLSGARYEVTLGQGRDTLAMASLNGDAQLTPVRILDFEVGDNGDRLALQKFFADLLIGWQGDNPFGAGFVRLKQAGEHTRIEYRANGHGVWAPLITLDNVDRSALTLANLGWAPDGSNDAAMVWAGDGSDEFMAGGSGADSLTGKDGADQLYGNGGADRLDGGRGADYLNGGLGDDVVLGGAGADTINDSGGSDRLYGAGGNDYIVVYRAGAVSQDKVSVYGDIGDDRVEYAGNSLNEVSLTVFLGDGADTFTGSQLASASIDAGAGDDTLIINGTGSAVIKAGEGSDTALFWGQRNFATNIIDLGGGDDRLTIALYDATQGSSNRVYTGAGSDTVTLSNTGGQFVAPDNLTIMDFTGGDGGDVLEFSAYMRSVSGWNGVDNPFGTQNLSLYDSEDGVHVVVEGQEVALLAGVTMAGLTDANLGGHGWLIS